MFLHCLSEPFPEKLKDFPFLPDLLWETKQFKGLVCAFKISIVVQWLSRVRLFANTWTAAHQTSLSFTVSQNLFKLMSTESMMASNHLILSYPHLLLPSVFPSIMVFSMSWLFASSGQNIGASTSVSMNIQGQFPLGLTGLISLQSKGLSRVFPTPQFKSINASALSLLYGPNPSSVHDYQKTVALTMYTFVRKLMSLLFNALSRFIMAFLPRSKCLLISWLQSPSVVILGKQDYYPTKQSQM